VYTERGGHCGYVTGLRRGRQTERERQRERQREREREMVNTDSKTL
jgi:hypothetical protein